MAARIPIAIVRSIIAVVETKLEGVLQLVRLVTFCGRMVLLKNETFIFDRLLKTRLWKQ